MKILTKQNMLDYVTGAVILGCGGGGGAGWGTRMIEDAFEGGHEFKLAEINEVPDDKMLCILAGVGGGVTEEIRDKVAPYYKRFEPTAESRVTRLRQAARELSEYLGEEIYSFIAAETGGGNGVLPMFLNALEGNPSIDADCCGRAKPEMGISLTTAVGIPITPLAMVSPFMETVILKSAVDDNRAEDITRHVAVACGGGVTVARCPATVKDYKHAVAPNQVSRCIKIGQVIREAKEKGEDVEEDFLEASGGSVIFKGNVSAFNSDGRGGFNWGDWIINGTDNFEDQTLRVWFKNEHLVSWLDDKPYVMGPDLICIVEDEAFEGLSNFVPEGTHDGKDVTVFGLRAIDAWKTNKGIELFGPRHFGFDFEYIPL